MSGFPFLQQPINNSAFNSQVANYKLHYREKEKRDVEYEFHVISNIYKTSTSVVKSIWNKIGKINKIWEFGFEI